MNPRFIKLNRTKHSIAVNLRRFFNFYRKPFFWDIFDDCELRSMRLPSKNVAHDALPISFKVVPLIPLPPILFGRIDDRIEFKRSKLKKII